MMLSSILSQDLLIKLLLAGFSGFLLKYTLQKTNQRWLSYLPSHLNLYLTTYYNLWYYTLHQI